MDAFSAPKPSRRSFTLVEMLAVVVIIAILASLITGAAIAARRRARIAVIKMEITQLDMAIRAYRERFGEYPPDFGQMDVDAKKAAVVRHLRRAFPRYTLVGTTVNDKWDDLNDQVSVNINDLDPASALFFWLGGPGGDGFSANPQAPFAIDGSRIGPFFDFEPDRLSLSLLEYFPDGAATVNGQRPPYLYFMAQAGSYSNKNWTSAIWGAVRPYEDTRTDNWVNPRSFQIISAGLDGKFGATNTTDGTVQPAGDPGTDPPWFPSGANYFSDPDYPQYLGQHDNITNFSKGTLEDEMP